MPKYFVSYARADQPFVWEITTELRAAGADLWLDLLDILPGRHWDESIQEALRACPGLLVVLSPDAVGSRNVMDEVSWALDQDKVVVPLLYRPCEVPFRLGRVQYIDFTSDRDRAIEALLKALQINRPATPTTLPPAVDQPPAPPGSVVEVRPVATRRPIEELAVPVKPVPLDSSGTNSKPGFRAGLLQSKLGLIILLGLVCLANWLETDVLEQQDWWQQRAHPLCTRAAEAFTWFEVTIGAQRAADSFRGHDTADMLGVWGYAIAYFFMLPVLALACGITLALRQGISPFRVLCLAVAIDYLLSVPFFLFFPVPERWSYPEASAILLSDRISTSAIPRFGEHLIELLRPISGLDNCFPSFHVSLTVILILAAWIFGFRFWRLMAAIGSLIIIATFFLGIHWLPDMIAGLCVAIISVALALRVDRRLEVAARRLAR